MSLVTPNTVLDHIRVIDGDADRAQTVADHGPQAEERMRDVLTADRGQIRDSEGRPAGIINQRDRGDVYDDIVDGDGDWDSNDKDRLEKAETVYAFAESLPELNIDISEGGGLVESTGFEQSRTRYRTTRSIAQTQSALKSQAIRMARGLLSRHNREDPDPVYVL